MYSMLAHIFIWKFETQRKTLLKDITCNKNKITEVEIARNTVLIRGINQEMGLKSVKAVFK